MNSSDSFVDHPHSAERFIADEERTDWHNQSLYSFREKRDAAAAKIKEWETLRNLASQVKDNVLSDLDRYLEQFERKAQANGATVHWAKDAKDHNRIVLEILQHQQISRIVKSKSMLTEECHLNPFLDENGIEVIDTDLGEWIIQLRKERPSHIVAPAIHLKKEEIGQTFHQKLDTEKGVSDPKYLTEAARQFLRKKFMDAQAALTGVNFAIAETGSVVVCTNEGNADMGVHRVPIQIHCMGIEKIIPEVEHLGIFTRLLARSSTGQPITIYTSHHQRPKPGGEMHIVILDNGRSRHLARSDFRSGLKCIRCGACMNTCPVYRRSGGYSYGDSVPGPIGSILTPGRDLKKYSTLPFASSLCGSCSDVCPVKIDIHEQLYKWRQIVGREQLLGKSKYAIMSQSAKVLASPVKTDRYGRWLSTLLRWLPRFAIYHRFNTWGRQRELPNMSEESFKTWISNNRPDVCGSPQRKHVSAEKQTTLSAPKFVTADSG
ncbi:MAG: lactate utilization protein, partial [Saprospiraceae bacterium]|nr:lactate utilization protein [Saprospiraceae bacterium]